MDGKCPRLGNLSSALVGHQIPAWYNAEGEIYVGEEAPEGDGWTQDEDVLDTWFSSALLAILYHGLAGCRLRRL